MAMAGNLFSGVGGFDLGLERAGWSVAWQSEIDSAATGILARHWPTVSRHGDIRALRGADLGPVDLICGGFPCQDLSVAGRRAGLAGERSGLFYECMRVVAACAPRWVLLENVPGLLSSNDGRDMATVVGTLGELGYGWAYRVLDAQYFGVAQRRRRVFIVGCLGDPARAAAVLFEPESGAGDSAPRRETGARAAASLTAGAHGARVNDPGRHHEDDVNLVVAGGVTARYGKGPDSDATDALVYQCHGSNVGPMGTLRQGDGGLTSGVPFVAHSLNGNSGRRQVEETYVTHSLRPAGCDASEDGTGRGTPLVAVSTNQRGAGDLRPAHGSLNAHHSGKQFDGVLRGMAVRRLMPRECERLMGLPDDWTAVDAEGRALADTTRYRLLGNSIVVPVAEWIGRRLLESA